MKPPARMLVVSSCTGEKAFTPEGLLTREDLSDPGVLERRERELSEFLVPARDMYTGRQHVELLKGLSVFRHAQISTEVDLLIVSAGYGLISEAQAIAPYELTFAEMTGGQIDSWAQHLRIHDDLERALPSYDLAFVLLGEKYLRAIRLPVATRADQAIVFLASRGAAERLPKLSARTHAVLLSNPEAREYRFGLVGLKGFLMRRLLERFSADPEAMSRVLTDPSYVEHLLHVDTKVSAAQPLFVDLPEPTPTRKRNRPDQSKIFADEAATSIASPPPNHAIQMRYFMPDADDRVDPNFDFFTDTHSPGRDPYSDDRYAHELFPHPNYDGMLVSKAIIEGNPSRSRRLNELRDVHADVRFNGPVMGDCGAFSYVKQDKPPYETKEILDYYQRFGFDYGVSIDHLIVGPFSTGSARDQRYELTLKNAIEFLQRYRKHGGYRFKPVAAIQGWDPGSYGAMAEEVINYGYDFVAVGGLARANTAEILEVADAIRPYLRADTQLHLFGVARLQALRQFRQLGVTSFDSASPLRRAWLSVDANYHGIDGRMYAAVRVPAISTRLLNDIQKHSSLTDAYVARLRYLEVRALNLLRAFDSSGEGLEDTLHAVLSYEAAITGEPSMRSGTSHASRRKHEEKYRTLLERAPWKSCPCPLCEQHGIEMAIFRGNNRNRRRGFHNTYVFYNRLKHLVRSPGE